MAPTKKTPRGWVEETYGSASLSTLWVSTMFSVRPKWTNFEMGALWSVGISCIFFPVSFFCFCPTSNIEGWDKSHDEIRISICSRFIWARARLCYRIIYSQLCRDEETRVMLGLNFLSSSVIQYFSRLTVEPVGQQYWYLWTIKQETISMYVCVYMWSGKKLNSFTNS